MKADSTATAGVLQRPPSCSCPLIFPAPSSEKWNGNFRPRFTRTWLGRNAAPRRLVDSAGHHGHRPRQLRHLRDMGGLGRQSLRMGTVSLALLLAADSDYLVAAFTRIPDPDFPRGLSS